jgi:serine protease AprX
MDRHRVFGRVGLAMGAVAAALAVAGGASAGGSGYTGGTGHTGAAGLSGFGASPFGSGGFNLTAYLPNSLLDSIHQNPLGFYDVIVQAADARSSAAVASAVQFAQTLEGGAGSGQVQAQFSAISGVAARITGWQILRLATRPGILAITPNAAIDSIAPATKPTTGDYKNAEMWRDSVDATPLISSTTRTPAIAVVDSGIDSRKTVDFGGRVIGSVNLVTGAQRVSGDQEGHGTMVAGLAAGASPTYPGVAPTARLIDVKTANAAGESTAASVIMAADWILRNKDRYGIRVANFSLVSAPISSFTVDPLNRAIERLWLNGIVVVAAAGNYGQGAPVDVSHAPGDDPFVITVGALDQNQTSTVADDTVAPWSAFGTTQDGFSKPDVGAPGRYLIAPVPSDSYLPSVVPGRVVAPGYMWMSGTSFAAPIVAGAAAQILAAHPDWTPDQVKGALIATARALPAAGTGAGAGEIDVVAAAALTAPPSANAAVDSYVVTDPLTGLRSFNSVAWLRATNPSIFSPTGSGSTGSATTSASWSSASWTSASWSSASWSSASWTSSLWSSASWTSASWSSASWSSLEWDD